jgi:hypothetical protein
LDTDPDLPDIRDDDPRWVRCAVYTRQSVKRLGDDPAVTSCAIQRTLCTEFIRSKTWEFWYSIAERFDDEGESGATLERPGLAKLLRRIEGGDIHRIIVYRVDRLTRKLADLARLASHFERHRVGPRWSARPSRFDRLSGGVLEGAGAHRRPSHARIHEAKRARRRRAEGDRALQPVRAARAPHVRHLREDDDPVDE